MKIAAITITLNRLELTKKTVDSFYSKANVDYHLFIDNGSTDGTIEWLDTQQFDYYPYPENIGITKALAMGVRDIINDDRNFDLILKLDNDIEVVTDHIVDKVIDFYKAAGNNFVVAPVDLNLNPDFTPAVIYEGVIAGHRVRKTSHVGGAFMIMPVYAARMWLEALPVGDLQRGYYFQSIDYPPTYLLDLEMKHMGLESQVKDYKL